MYSVFDYIKRSMRFANNVLRPGSKKLSTLMLYGTELCDSKCKHCHIWAKRPVRHLPLEKIIEIMNSKCVSKNTNVGLEGGEFLLHPQAMEILKWFSENHPNFDLLSNCLKPENVIDAVKNYPPQRLYISLDGTKETYEYMRGKDGYDKVISVIESCKDIVPISLMFTLSPYNSFMDLEHVVDLAHKYNIDIRIGIYNDIALFDTVEKAHETEIGRLNSNDAFSYKKEEALLEQTNHTNANGNFITNIPQNVKNTSENYDFLVLYDEWRKNRLKIKCYSLMDSLVIHPDGSVPICQNLETKLGNVYENTLDEIFNSKNAQKIQKQHMNHCNECWINFHRKYDIVLLRTLEKVFPKSMIELFYGKYNWTSDPKMTYKKLMEKYGC